MPTAMLELSRWILDRDDIALVPHVSPDGDAYGSTVALALGLRKLGKRVFVASGEYPVARMYAFLPGLSLVYAAENAPFAPRYVLYMDTASPDRAGVDFSTGISGTALLDHHATNPGFGDVRVIDGNASSTGELVFRLLKEMGVEIDGDMAICLYTAISTDTGNFQFASTTPEALEYSGELVRLGLDIADISAKLFRTRTLARTRLLGEALSAMRLVMDGRVAMTLVTREMMLRLQAGHPDTESIVNFLNEIEGVEASAMLEERECETKISLRSAGRVDVSNVAKQLGGGGHTLAAGATLKAGGEEAFRRVEGLLREAVG